jgi:hypothetical protein
LFCLELGDFVGFTKHTLHMDYITLNSPHGARVLALQHVRNAISSLVMVGKIGLSTGNTTKALEDLRIYEKQLSDSIKL